MKRIFTLIITTTVALGAMTTNAFASTFTDINNVPWSGASEVIERVAEKGLVNGYGDGTFKAFNNVTYLETMQMVYTALIMSGQAQTLPMEIITQYSNYMDGLQIPDWARVCVTYGLYTDLISLVDLSGFMNGNVSNYATREDVATIFAKAFSGMYDISTIPTEATKFGDYSEISESKKNYIDTVVRLGVIVGDDNGNFNPQKLINRAEMAVVLDRSYNLLEEGIFETGVITNISRISEIYIIQIKFDDGTVGSYSANSTSAEVTAGEKKTTSSLSKLMIGDAVEVVVDADLLKKLHAPNLIVTEMTYNITGYVDSFKDGVLRVENENTETYETYNLTNNTEMFVKGERVDLAELEEAINSSSLHAYIGLNVSNSSISDSDSSGNIYLEKDIVVDNLNVEFSNRYTKRGYVTSLSSEVLKINSLTHETSRQYNLNDDIEYYIDGRLTSFKEFQSLVDDGTVYLTATITSSNVLITIEASNMPFQVNSELSNTIYSLKSLSNSKLLLTSSSKNYTYDVSSATDVEYYWWEKDSYDVYSWKNRNISSMIALKEEALDDDLTVYVKVVYNNAGKITRIEMSDIRSAWTVDTSYGNSENRKGVVQSVSSDTLMFENVSTKYEMLKSYNISYDDTYESNYVIGVDPNDSSKKVRNPLTIEGSQTSSLTVFNRMVSSDDVVVYAEILADASNVVQQIDAKLIEATGYLNYCDTDEDKLTLELDNGEKIYLILASKPSVCDGIGELSNLNGSTHLGSKIYLEFNDYGEINLIELVTESGYITGNKVSGRAIGTDNGFEMVSTGQEVSWGSRSSVYIKNYSSTSTTSYGVDKMLADPDVDVIVDATLSNGSLTMLDVYVDYAMGEFENYDRGLGQLRIKTATGQSYTFFISLDIVADINGIGLTDLNNEAVGMDVELVFTDGLITKIRG